MRLISQVSPRSEAFAENRKAMLAQLDVAREAADLGLAGGGERARERHLSRGKLLPRDRVEGLLDRGSPFLEIGLFAAHGHYGDAVPAAGAIAGIGRVKDRKVMALANDTTVKGGAYFPLTAKQHLRAQEIAEANRLPCAVADSYLKGETILAAARSCGAEAEAVDAFLTDKGHRTGLDRAALEDAVSFAGALRLHDRAVASQAAVAGGGR